MSCGTIAWIAIRVEAAAAVATVVILAWFVLAGRIVRMGCRDGEGLAAVGRRRGLVYDSTPVRAGQGVSGCHRLRATGRCRFPSSRSRRILPMISTAP